MRRARIAVAVMAALGVFSGNAYAQQPGDAPKKPASQTHDQGVDDDKTPPGQARKGPGDRIASQVPVTVYANGMAVAELDESFDEAMVVTLHPDGTRTYDHVQGTATAAALVQAQPKPATSKPPLEEK